MDTAGNEENQQNNGIIPEWGVDRIWFSAGVVIGNAGMIPFLMAEVGTVYAITAGLISAVAFLLAFNMAGEFKIFRSIPGILFAGAGAVAFTIPLIGILGWFFAFIIAGWLMVGLIYIARGFRKQVVSFSL